MLFVDHREERPGLEPNGISAGLARIRRRRRFFWILVVVYLPSIWLSLRITHSDSFTAVIFLVWFALVIVGSCLVCFSPCPRCGNYFHMSGFMPVWLRRCIHCQLHLRADRDTKPN